MSERPLIDPSLLENLTEVEKAEALAAAAAAQRAEERAEQRMLEKAMERKRLERERERALELEQQRSRMKDVSGLASMNMNQSANNVVIGHGRSGSLGDNDGGGGGSNGNSSNKVVFISKKRRAEMKEKGNIDGNGNDNGNGNGSASHKKVKSNSGDSVAATLFASRNASARSSRNNTINNNRSDDGRQQQKQHQHQHQLTTSELNAIKKTYLGESALQDEETLQRKHKEERQRAKQKKKTMFKFEWDASEDTSMDADGMSMPTMMSTMRNNRSRNNGNGSSRDDRRGGRYGDSRSRTGNRDRDERGSSVLTKPIAKMTKRDWRIFRENYDITVRGGKAPPPLRNFRESSTSDVPAIHPVIINAIENVLRYREPSPIQRQAIPIGLQRRDLIGVAETGSGKTAAFGIPLIQLIFSLPQKALDTVAENGPLALVMAPTRELAIQIDVEFQRILSRQKNIKTACIVGGQPIQKQAMELRGGVHVIVGTPGRLNDCLEEAYLVLNQCSYIVLDEADRMIDLGFAPQIESILDAMGGLLKSENEKEAYDQELKDLREISEHVPTHRLTAMFSATMPAEVQRIARKYLRHPAVVSIGGPGGGGKNKRIDQRVLFLSSPGMKEKALREVLQKTRNSDKIIVFVNEKKHTEGVSRSIERMGRRTVVLHGGKTQDQREENLAMFKRGEVILVATDVAGRGLDIPNIKHVINYDVPSRSIDSYCHRIGRTARAGATGIATSFITDQDEGIMAPLKSYLESVGAPVPDRLARHPAAASAGGRSIIH